LSEADRDKLAETLTGLEDLDAVITRAAPA
jgi:hypothetical protein